MTRPSSRMRKKLLKMYLRENALRDEIFDRDYSEQYPWWKLDRLEKMQKRRMRHRLNKRYWRNYMVPLVRRMKKVEEQNQVDSAVGS